MGVANIAAQIHANMCNDPRFGYSWSELWGAGDTVTWHIEGRDYTVNVGDYDCSSSVITAWSKALEGTDYEGALDGATYTGNMRRVFEDSGLFYSSYDNAERGDVYLNDEYHTALCQDGGYDDVYGYDCLSEFCINENGEVYGGQRGDQTDWESYIHGFYEYPWNATLHYNGKADSSRRDEIVTELNPGAPVNDNGIRYRAHVQDYGWLDWVRDGQAAGTTGGSKRLEAIQIDPPVGVRLRVKAHIADVGWRTWDNIEHGNVEVIGTTGQHRQIEALIIERLDGSGKTLKFQVHQADVGWKGITEQGYATGTDGMAMRLEAVKIWLD